MSFLSYLQKGLHTDALSQYIKVLSAYATSIGKRLLVSPLIPSLPLEVLADSVEEQIILSQTLLDINLRILRECSRLGVIYLPLNQWVNRIDLSSSIINSIRYACPYKFEEVLELLTFLQSTIEELLLNWSPYKCLC